MLSANTMAKLEKLRLICDMGEQEFKMLVLVTEVAFLEGKKEGSREVKEMVDLTLRG